MEKKTMIIIIVVVSVVIVLALVLGLVFGLKKDNDDKDTNPYNVLNSYDNTDELIQKYPVINPTEVKDGIEKQIQNRLLTGFENWNRGFDTWKAWGNILYINDSIYNVHGARLSLASYQAAMDISLKQQTILMGDFHNMIIINDFAAIHYDFKSGPKGGELKTSRVMEFVKFKDYGKELGTRVVEGWGSTKDQTVEGLKTFQEEKEKQEQAIQDHFFMKYYQLPITTNLKEKYFIINPTEYSGENANDILNTILEGFEKWNTDINSYKSWVDTAYDSNAISSSLSEVDRTMTIYKEEMETLFAQEKIEKLYFDNILTRDDWAAIHYRYRRFNKTTNELTSFGDRMEFFKFERKNGALKITGNWIQ